MPIYYSADSDRFPFDLAEEFQRVSSITERRMANG